MKHIAGKHENSEKYLCVIYTRNTYLFLFTLRFYILCTLGYVSYIILYTTRRSQGMNVRVLYYYYYTGNGGVNLRIIKCADNHNDTRIIYYYIDTHRYYVYKYWNITYVIILIYNYYYTRYIYNINYYILVIKSKFGGKNVLHVMRYKFVYKYNIYR